MNDVKNVLLIGRTGGGKSTLANVLTGTSNFVESSRTTSQTRTIEEGLVEIDVERDGSEKIRYRIIDTIGIGDTKLTPQGVLTKLAEMAGRVKREGLNHILFVTKGRFSKEEIEAYDLLSSIIFDKDVIKYTTIVRTGFPEFEDREACEDDRAALRIENADLVHILGSVNIVYVDNPPLKGRPRAVEDAKECREESRKRLLTYLATRQEGNYRPSNIDTLDERVLEYKTNEQKLKDKMKELEKARKEQEEKFRQEIANLKEEQARELRENRIKFEEDIRKVKVEGEEKLRTTVNTMEDKRRRDMENLESRNQQQISNLQESHRREAQSIREAGEQQMRAIQAQVQQSQQETERLQRELEAKSSSSNNDIALLLAEFKESDRKWEEQREDQRQEYEERRDRQDREFRQQNLALERERIKADNEREERHRKDEAAARKEAQEREEQRRQEDNEREERRRDELRGLHSEMRALQVQSDKDRQAAKDAKDALDAKNNRNLIQRIFNK
jgi:hypothetical protein